MQDFCTETREAAAQAREVLLSLASEGGVLHQIQMGERDWHLPKGSAEARDLLVVMRDRARLDRTILDRFAPPS